MTDLKNYISELGKPDAIIDYNGNDGLIAGIWGCDEFIECIDGFTYLN